MIKKFFIISTLAFLSLMPIFGLTVKLPSNSPGGDINVGTNSSVKWYKNSWEKLHKNAITDTIKIINEYLRRSFWVICTGLVIYSGFGLITAREDEKKLKQAQRTLIGSLVGICIAMLSYAIINIIVNLF